jgi:hypothetical protein
MKARAPWLLWGVTFAGVAAIILLSVFSREAEREGEIGLPTIVAFLIFELAFATTGALIASRHPRNPVGWIAGGVALVYVLAGIADSFADGWTAQASSAGPFVRTLVSIGESLWVVSLGLGGTLLLLLFPDGTLLSRRWRVPAVIAAAALVVTPVAAALIPGDIQGYPIVNPLGIRGAGPFLEALVGLGVLAIVLTILMSMASLFLRYRRGSVRQRQQLKWLLFSVVAVVVMVLTGTLIEAAGGNDAATEIANLLSTSGLSVIPIAIGVAILRHRLYDIDVIINRALVYGALTGSLALAYAAIVFGLQQVLSPFTQQSDIAVVVSTLAVAALFRPLRSRLQTFIDRRFYRRKFDAQQTLEDFGAAARTEVGLGAVSQELVDVVNETMEPAHISLWLRAPEANSLTRP